MSIRKERGWLGWCSMVELFAQDAEVLGFDPQLEKQEVGSK